MEVAARKNLAFDPSRTSCNRVRENGRYGRIYRTPALPQPGAIEHAEPGRRKRGARLVQACGRLFSGRTIAVPNGLLLFKKPSQLVGYGWAKWCGEFLPPGGDV